MPNPTSQWFDVDREGLRQILERRGKGWAIFELIQNCWDTHAKTVAVTLDVVAGAPQVWLTVEDDDPDGFRDLTHAFTLFKSSDKKIDPTKRGRFNLGCKLVLALCREATVTSTTGAIRFDEAGRHRLRRRRTAGSMFRGLLAMTRDELADVEAQIVRLIAPANVRTTIRIQNGDQASFTAIEPHKPHEIITTTLPTEIADKEGYLRPAQRKTEIHVFHALPDDSAWLFELGIPVQPIEGPWSVSVQQKVPLGLDRDAVSASYVAKLQTVIANATVAELPPSAFTAPWMAGIVQDPNVAPAVVERYLKAKYGDRFVIDEPGRDGQESVREAQAAGYVVIRGNAEAKGTWDQIRAHGLAKPVRALFPRPDTSSDWHEVPFSETPPNYVAAMRYAELLAERLLGKRPQVRLIFGPTIHAATWARSTPTSPAILTFNLAPLGATWFAAGPHVAVHDLLIHEFAHEAGDHLETCFDDALSRLGAQLTELALTEPEFFAPWRKG